MTLQRITADDVYVITARLLLARDPSAIVEHHIDAAVRAYRRILRETLRIVRSEPAPWWAPRITELLGSARLDELANSIAMVRLRGLALGADDSRIELDEPEGDIDTPDAFVRCLDTLRLRKRAPRTKPRGRVASHLDPVSPWPEVLEEFLDRGAVTRDTWNVLEAAERQQAFTVAHQSSASFVSQIQEVVARGIADGLPARDVVKRIREAGETITAAHAETVYRNAVQSAYSRGRAEHMTQPHVFAARPWWQYRSVADVRTRPTHRAPNGWVMRGDDPGWQTTYPPNGHRCRCRCVARSQKWVQDSGVTIWSGPLPNLPDPGWHGTAPPIPRAA